MVIDFPDLKVGVIQGYSAYCRVAISRVSIHTRCKRAGARVLLQIPNPQSQIVNRKSFTVPNQYRITRAKAGLVC